MRLPQNNAVEKVPDKNCRAGSGLDKIYLAYRAPAMFLYATDGKCLVRVEVESSADEIASIAAMAAAAGFNPEKAAIEIEIDTYKSLRKGRSPIAIGVIDKKWFIRQMIPASLFQVEATATCRQVDMMQSVLDGEFDRAQLGTLAFSPGLVELCREAIGQNDGQEFAEIECPLSAGRPILMRQGASIAAVMPCSNWDLSGIEKLCEAAREALTHDHEVTNAHEFARLVLKTFGRTFEE